MSGKSVTTRTGAATMLIAATALAGCGTAQPPTTPELMSSSQSVAGCTTAELDVSLGEPQGAAGSTVYALIFTNVSGDTCTLQGFPGVSYVTGADGSQIGRAAERSGATGGAVSLNPDGQASARIRAVDVENYPADVCDPMQVAGFRIYPPNDYDSLYVANSATACANINADAHQLDVTTVVPGVQE
ncbi:DUF4232 domain-containing protein [Hoyosella sp. YIM 151337]|uniref:DUF4232 domain-containing protein n=1 Tax=Hoyosella sp. YIM 151337 TaxID=2992742 RepID=UPI0022369FC9|nr:DUF4232 domain-containing protein [Hoyosella sp. YIM 151337]MCW4355799.1 DUF4232 domain-containing protein [Hoyosella sp. YIM 151337]